MLNGLKLGNKVYDLTDWTHPGGNFIIQACLGREIGRYFYGNYALEGTNMKPHKHSALTLKQINSFYVGEISNFESILVSKKTELPATSQVVSEWKISSIRQVTETVSEVNFVSEEFKVKNFGTSPSWLGRHFTVSFARDNSAARLYTTAVSLNQSNYNLRQNMYEFFDKIMAGQDAQFTYDANYLASQDCLPIYIKKYPFAGGLSKAIHDVDVSLAANRFRIHGPVSRGLELTAKYHWKSMHYLCWYWCSTIC